MPYVGAMFRRVEHTVNEIETLITVTPEIVDAMDPHEVPPCGPGMSTSIPSDLDLYWRGHIEVPNCYCFPGAGGDGGDGCNGCGAAGVGAATAGDMSDAAEEVVPENRGASRFRRLPQERTGTNLPEYGATRKRILRQPGSVESRRATPAVPVSAATRPYMRNAGNQSPARSSSPAGDGPGLIGPIGYDVTGQ
jgi:pilus assembly protein CpaC